MAFHRSDDMCWMEMTLSTTFKKSELNSVALKDCHLFSAVLTLISSGPSERVPCDIHALIHNK